MLLPERVRRKLQELFIVVEARAHAANALRSFAAENAGPETERIELAILKLSEGDPQRLSDAVEAARADYRDVLAWAEYPEEFRLGPDATPEGRSAARKRDRAQYLQWLGD